VWNFLPWRDRRAVTAMEYAVIAGVMVAIIVSATGPFFSGLAGLLDHVSDGL
jgi:Flp pilus assembly pilin Flp